MLLRYGAVIAALIIWGSVGIMTRYMATDPLLIVTYRVIFAAMALAPLALLRRGRPGQGAQTRWWLLLVSGLILALNWLFYLRALVLTQVVNAVLAYYTAPILVAIAAPFLFRERLEGRTMVAALVAGGGLVLILSGPGVSLSASDLAGIGWGLLAAVFYAGVTLLGRVQGAEPPARLVFWQALSAAAILLPTVLMTKGAGALRLDPLPLLLLIILGVVHTAGALILYFWGLAGVKVQHLSVLGYLDPVASVVLAFLFLGERPGVQVIAGGALILGASLLLVLKRTPKPTVAN